MKFIGIERRLEKIRKLQGFSQEYVASKLKISQNSYSRIERGETKVTLKKLTEICKVLEIDIKTLQNFDPFQEFKELIEEASVPWIRKVLDSLEKGTKLYEDLLQEKNARIKDLEFINSILKKKNSV